MYFCMYDSIYGYCVHLSSYQECLHCVVGSYHNGITQCGIIARTKMLL